MLMRNPAYERREDPPYVPRRNRLGDTLMILAYVGIGISAGVLWVYLVYVFMDAFIAHYHNALRASLLR